MAWTLVTGGSRRLGATICLALAQQGRSVVIHYNQEKEEALKVAEQCHQLGVQAAILQGDFSTSKGLQAFAQNYLHAFPDTEGLIHNVGPYLVGSALHTQTEDWLHLFQLNLHAPFELTQALIPALIAHQGQIITLGVSGLNRQSASTRVTAYVLAKQALWGLTRSWARELAPFNVRVNMVSPGQLTISIDPPKDLNQLPMHRLVECEEVCRVITFLLARENGSITGQNIEVAGGFGLA